MVCYTIDKTNIIFLLPYKHSQIQIDYLQVHSMPNKYCPWVFVFKLMWEQFGKEKHCLIFSKLCLKNF